MICASLARKLITPTHYGGRKGIFNRPAMIKTKLNCRTMNAGYPRPLSRYITDPVESNNSIVGFILRLFQPCSPMAIFWFIPFSVVNSINRMLRGWPFTHIIQEGLKAIYPTLANIHPARSVLFVCLLIWVQASTFHACPYLIFLRIREAVSGLYFSILFVTPTTAAYTFPTLEITRKDLFFFSAIADTKPVTLSEIRFYCPTIETLTSYILRFHGYNISNLIRMYDLQFNYTRIRRIIQ